MKVKLVVSKNIIVGILILVLSGFSIINKDSKTSLITIEYNSICADSLGIFWKDSSLAYFTGINKKGELIEIQKDALKIKSLVLIKKDKICKIDLDSTHFRKSSTMNIKLYTRRGKSYIKLVTYNYYISVLPVKWVKK